MLEVGWRQFITLLLGSAVATWPIMVRAQQPTMPVIAAKAATSTMPIVYMSNDDPRKYGLVFSLQKLKTRVGRQIFRLFHQVPYDGTTWNMDQVRFNSLARTLAITLLAALQMAVWRSAMR
jgi:hypothetical protein